MRHQDAVNARVARDAEYRAERDAQRRRYEFRRAIIGARINAGLTQQALAKSAGLPRSTIARLESGEGNPTIETLCKLAGVLEARFQVDADGLHIQHDASHEVVLTG